MSVRSIFSIILMFIIAGCSNGDNINNNNMSSPSIAEDSTYLYRVWTDKRNGNEDIFFARSEDGFIWTDEKRLNDDSPGSNNVQTSPQIAINESNGEIYVVWEDYRDGNADIFLSASTNQGQSWSETNQLVNQSNLSANQTNPSLDAYSNCGVHVAWTDDNDATSKIHINKSFNLGLAWIGDLAIQPDSIANQDASKVAIGSDCSTMAVWEEGDTLKDIYASFNPGGIFSNNINESWQQPFILNSITTGDQSSPDITISVNIDRARNSEFFVVWQDNRNSDYDIFIAQINTDVNSANVGTNVMINDAGLAGVNQTAPTIGSSGSPSGNDLFYAAWVDDRKNNGITDIYTDFSADGNGHNWGTDFHIGVANQSLKQTNPQISIQIKNKLIAIWEEEVKPGIKNLLGSEI